MANDLIVIDENKIPDLYSEKQIDDTLEKIKTFARSVVIGDVTTKQGSADVRTMAARVRSTKAAMVKAGEALSGDIKKKAKVQTDRIGEQVAKIETELDTLYTEIRKPLTEYEEKEKTRKNAHEAACGVIAQALMFPAGTVSATLTDRIAQIEALKDRDWEEFEDIAEKLLEEKLPELIKHRDSLIATENMVAENARLKKEAEDRKADDERRAAEDKQKEHDAALLLEAEHREYALAAGGWDDRIKAADKARKDAAEAELRELVLAAGGWDDKIKVADKAKKDERDRVAAKALKDQQDEDQRKANEKHRGKITTEIADDLVMNCALMVDEADKIIAAIEAGKIRNVIIKF